MRSLKLNDIAVSLGIRIYCNSCGYWYDPRTEHLKHRKVKCSHPPHKQRYKSTIIEPANGGKRKRKSIIHSTRNLQDVILLGLEYKNQVKTKSVEQFQKQKSVRPKLLIDCLAMFLDYKNDVGVEDHLKRGLSRSSLTEFKSHIVKWKNATDIIGEQFGKLQVDKISSQNVSSLIKYLSTYSNSTQKKAFGFYNQFYRHLNRNGYVITSPFRGIEVSDEVTTDARAVTFVEFNKVLEALSSGSPDDRVYKRRVYFKCLTEAMNFAALTGRRVKHEFMEAKFSDIRLVDGELLGGYILMLDSKYSKQNKHKIGFKPRYTKAPIFLELYEFLIKMGYEEYKDSDRYIVCGAETKKRVTLSNNLTNAFGYYRDKIGMDKKVQLKGLRKKYVTRMRNEFGDNASFFTGHADGRIDKKHYYDDSEMFRKVKDFKLW